MKQLTIISTHTKLAEAVEISGMDLSYNEAVAQTAIKNADAPCRWLHEFGIRPTQQAFVVTDGSETFVIYSYMAQGIRFIRRFCPFVNALDNRAHVFWEMNAKGTNFAKTHFSFTNNQAGRACCKQITSVLQNYYVAAF